MTLRPSKGLHLGIKAGTRPGIGSRFGTHSPIPSGGGAAAEKAASATNFDGTNDYLTHATGVGAADGFTGTVSLWFLLNGGDGAGQWIFRQPNGRFFLYRRSTNELHFELIANNGTTVLARRYTAATYTVASGWTHVLWSFDHTSGASPVMQAYINDAAVTWGTPNTVDGGSLGDFTDTGFHIGQFGSGIEIFNGCLSEVYIHLSDYIDISVEANRRKFISAGGKPVEMGADGSTPTGTQPHIYLPNAFGTFQNNAGSGGNFTVTGALTACGSTP